ncbi:MAG: GNAT family N-acetyltransferase [Granulosicoccus sp.]
MKGIVIRPASIDDAALIHEFILDLARFENAEEEVVATVSDIERSLFGTDTSAYALIGSVNEKPVSTAIYFYNYSTWAGKKGLFLEDLYVSAESRGSGVGRAMLAHLAKLAVEQGCGRFEWNVLDWNVQAIKVYDSIGAMPQNEWIGYRLSGDALARLASS